MNTAVCTLTVNRLFASFLTLSILFTTSNLFAFNDTQKFPGEPVIGKASDNPGIEYASLVANATDKSVFINWVTASELNNSHFEVERSLDNQHFKTVAMVLDGFEATGSTGKSYKFKEASGIVKNGKIVYYRLKQIDTDNRVHYSAIMAVQMNVTVKIFPNTVVSSEQTADNTNWSDVLITQKLLSKQTVTNPGL